MKRIIEGKQYNTSTAKKICVLKCNEDSGDFRWHSSALYLSPKGTYFIAGKGNARSRWAEPVGGNAYGPGSGLEIITPEEARRIAEEALLDEEDMDEAGFLVEVG